MDYNPFKSADWTEKSLQDMWAIIRKIAKEDFNLDFYEPAFEIVTFEDMLGIYCTSFPVMYNYWGHGKEYEQMYKQYKDHKLSIAYEVVFNTDPALCYLLETNTSVMQALVMAHAACGHSAFFKHNSLISDNTNARAILSQMRHTRDFVKECELKYGAKKVEEVLDVCESLKFYGINRSELLDLSPKDKEKRKLARSEGLEKDFDLKLATLDENFYKDANENKQKLKDENILNYIATYSPTLKGWERELIFKFCQVQQYFYPNICTKLMNEGYASFWHYQIMNRLSELGYLDVGQMFEFLQSHTSVVCQHDYDSPYYSGINPYHLGYNIFNEIKRICVSPTEEDKFYFPDLIGKNWIEVVHYAAKNFKDDSFILQYLTPKLMRELKLFSIKDSDFSSQEVTATSSDEDFYKIRMQLSKQYTLFNHIPVFYVEGSDLRKTRTLFLVMEETIESKNESEISSIDADGIEKTLNLMKRLWNFPIKLRYITYSGNIFKGTVE